MPLTPTEIERKLRQHDNDIAEIYVKLVSIERKADDLKVQVETRFDRIEARLQGIEVVAGTSRADLDARLGSLSTHMNGIDTHLAGIDAHLTGMDATLVEMVRRLPEPA